MSGNLSQRSSDQGSVRLRWDRTTCAKILVAVLLATVAVVEAPNQGWTWWWDSPHVIHGKVIHVHDGDTLTVLTAQKEKVRVRLAEIDAPEIGGGSQPSQPYGKQAQRYLEEMCKGQEADVEERGKDQYGRLVGKVWCGRTEANREMVRAGLAWVYDAYVQDRSLYRDQVEAQERRRGVWGQKDPVPPWVWRKTQKGHRDEGRENRRPY